MLKARAAPAVYQSKPAVGVLGNGEGCHRVLPCTKVSPRQCVWMMPNARAAPAVYQSKTAAGVLGNGEGCHRVLSCTKASPRRPFWTTVKAYAASCHVPK